MNELISIWQLAQRIGCSHGRVVELCGALGIELTPLTRHYTDERQVVGRRRHRRLTMPEARRVMKASIMMRVRRKRGYNASEELEGESE